MSITVTGCWDDITGLIVFTEGSCEYSGCLVKGGIHDGQIEVVISGDCCDSDTYYACLDKVSKKFEVEIPERCCEGVRSCVIGADSACDGSDIIPSKITLYVSRADRNCNAQSPFGNCKEIQNTAGDISGEHDLFFATCLNQADFPPFGTDCLWTGRIAGGNEWNVFFPTIATPCEGVKSGTCAGANSTCDPDFPALDAGVFAALAMGGGFGAGRFCRLWVHSYVKINETTWDACSSMFAHKILLSALDPGQTIFDYFATAKTSNTFGITQITVTGGSAYIKIPDDAVDYSAFSAGEEPC